MLFAREASLLQQIQHSAIPRLRDQFREGNRCHLVIEYCPGETLEEIFQRMALSLADVCILGTQLCSILEYLHTRQPAIIHRDIKPSNIIARPGGCVALIDFGIARLSTSATHEHTACGIFTTPRADTLSNLGSIGYAAPEQYGDNSWTLPCSDLYGLGVIMHQALSGLDPVEKPRERLFDFPPLGEHIPLALRTLVNGLVRRDAGARPQQARTVRFTLTSILEDLRGVSTPHRAGNFYGALALPDYFQQSSIQFIACAL
jgi:serine/threonine protein kinase